MSTPEEPTKKPKTEETPERDSSSSSVSHFEDLVHGSVYGDKEVPEYRSPESDPCD